MTPEMEKLYNKVEEAICPFSSYFQVLLQAGTHGVPASDVATVGNVLFWKCISTVREAFEGVSDE